VHVGYSAVYWTVCDIVFQHVSLPFTDYDIRVSRMFESVIGATFTVESSELTD